MIHAKYQCIPASGPKTNPTYLHVPTSTILGRVWANKISLNVA